MTSEEVHSCPVCQGTQFENPITCVDHTASGEMFHVKHCARCGLGITSPRPKENEAARFYKSDTYISHTGASRGLFDSIYLIIRHLTTYWKFGLVAPFLKHNPLLDFGCGTGTFLSTVRARKKEVMGIEPSPEARKKIDSAIQVWPALTDLPEKTFDVITLWHVLEHVYTFRETLRALKNRLSADGALFIAVPNHASADARHYGSNWAAYDVPRHLWHFSKESMAMFLQQEGLRIVKIIPMKLDAYYVSLLSEQYASPQTPRLFRMIRATAVAFRSNWNARRKNNQSSLIFVVQK